MKSTLIRKEQAMFAHENEERITKIIQSEGDPVKLAQVSPDFIVMDLTWLCNYHCLACVEEEAINKGVANLPVEIIEDVFDYSAAHSVRGIMTMGGEAFVYREGITAAMAKSIQHQLPIKTVTNGSLLDRYMGQVVDTYRIPGSQLRVSINADRANYAAQIRNQNFDLGTILDTMTKISARGIPLIVSTVVYPESSAQDGYLPNIHELENIIQDCENAGVKTHIIIPARNPITKARYKTNEAEKAVFARLDQGTYDLELETQDVVKKFPRPKHNVTCHPCPSNYMMTLIGSDGKVYKCSDNRGKPYAVIGQITQPGDFEAFWHSAKRVEMQQSIPCQNDGCIRCKENLVLANACGFYNEHGIDITAYLIRPPTNSHPAPIFR